MDKSLYPVLMCVCIAAAYIAYLFFKHKKYEAHLSLIRFSIERGQPLDPEIVNSLVQPQVAPPNNSMRAALALRIASTLVFSMGIGLPILGYFLMNVDPQAFPALQGTGGLFICMSVGLFVASKLVQSKVKADQSK